MSIPRAPDGTPLIPEGRYCTRVYIADDDKCDACGKNERSGVSFGYEAPVICFTCVGIAKILEKTYPGNPPRTLFLETRLQRKKDA